MSNKTTNRNFPNSAARRAFEKGWAAKAEEIVEMGLAAAISKFGADYPAPYRFSDYASEGAFWFGQGENAALQSYMGSRYDNTNSLVSSGN